MEAIRNTFNKYDADKSGCINAAEFRRLCYDMGYFLSDEEVSMDIKILDLDGSGSITYDEFIKWWQRDDRFKMLQIGKEDMERLDTFTKMFKQYDSDHSGCIDVREFKSLFVDLSKKKVI
ncbi:UNVERIFIED_CONTAM: hypothetical protein HDU68_003327 [Siphonaria sp. JEL0065]|nr:hypothetical protein HDU68_003327 [Siphonaria sp. JEL0065]